MHYASRQHAICRALRKRHFHVTARKRNRHAPSQPIHGGEHFVIAVRLLQFTKEAKHDRRIVCRYLRKLWCERHETRTLFASDEFRWAALRKRQFVNCLQPNVGNVQVSALIGDMDHCRIAIRRFEALELVCHPPPCTRRVLRKRKDAGG